VFVIRKEIMMDEQAVHEVLEGCKRLVREYVEENHDHRPCETGARAQLARGIFATLTDECIYCVMELEHHCNGTFPKFKAEAPKITMHVVEKFEPNERFSDVWPT